MMTMTVTFPSCAICSWPRRRLRPGQRVDPIKKRAKEYVILEPGNIKKSTIANTIARSLKVSVNEVLPVLPPGDAHIVKTAGLKLTEHKERS